MFFVSLIASDYRLDQAILTPARQLVMLWDTTVGTLMTALTCPSEGSSHVDIHAASRVRQERERSASIDARSVWLRYFQVNKCATTRLACSRTRREGNAKSKQLSLSVASPVRRRTHGTACMFRHASRMLV